MTAALPPMTAATIAAQIEKLHQMQEQAAEAVRQAEQAVAAGWQDVAAGTDGRQRKALTAARDQQDSIRIALAAAESAHRDALAREERERLQAKRAELVEILRIRDQRAVELAKGLDTVVAAIDATFRCSLDCRRIYGRPSSTLTDAGIVVDDATRELHFEHQQHLIELEFARRLPRLWRYERQPESETPLPIEDALKGNGEKVLAEFDLRYGTSEPLPE